MALVERLENRVLLHAGHAHAVVAAAPPADMAAPAVVESAPLAAVGDPRLPDLVPIASASRGYVYGWTYDVRTFPGRTLLRLSTALGNAGAGAMELRGGAVNPNGTQNVYQRLFLEGGGFSDRLAGTFTYHPTHNHTHFDNFAAYRLRTVTDDGGGTGLGVGSVVAAGDKVSFCLLDTDHYAPSLPGSPSSGRYFTCDAFQGISVGWADVYDQTLPDQWIDVTEVVDGRYWLEVVADPANTLVELDETNNTVRVPIDLRKPSQDPMVVSHVPAGQRPAPAGAIDFNFDQPMDAGSFDPAADVTRFTGPGGVDLRGQVTGFSWLDADTLRVTFQTQATEGSYAMAIGPQILAADNRAPMDQDRDKTPGEAGVDDYTATFTVTTRIGPDAYGYEAREHPFETIDLVRGAPGVITLLEGEDDAATAVPLGVNTFRFYGGAYTGGQSMFASTNGLITFGRGVTGYNNADLTSDPSQATIAPLWDDWRADSAAAEAVLARFDDTDTDGDHDRLVVEWSEVRRYIPDPETEPEPTGAVTFQAVLSLNTPAWLPGAIVFNYVDLDTGDGFSDGDSATVGIKAAGTQGGNRLLISRDDNTHPLVRSGKAIRIWQPPAEVVGRYVFYNGSVFDGGRRDADEGDDSAIAPDKAALQPGQAPSFANVTSYVRGINGLMLDVAGLPAATVPGTTDFSFSAGNNYDPASWAAAPPPAEVSIRRGAGANGSDRITVTWPDGAIVDRWLRVTFNAAARTRLAAPDVFYFGNLVGETGNDAAPVELKVNAQDLADAKGALITPSPLAGRYDFNRDGRVNALDIAALKAHLNRPLVLFSPPAAAALRAEDSISDLLR